LAIKVSESSTFVGNAIDVRGSIAHHAATEIADIPSSDVIPPEDEKIGFLCRHALSFLFFTLVWADHSGDRDASIASAVIVVSLDWPL
jgi:hypothetical protein